MTQMQNCHSVATGHDFRLGATGVESTVHASACGLARAAPVRPPTKESAMAYVDGFLMAVPKTNKDKFREHANKGDSVFFELGATRVLECWGDDVPTGKVTDFYRAVQAKDDEAVVFSWIEWPDKKTRDAAMSKMEELMKTDPRMNPETNPMPFDGQRLIYGGFVPLVTLER
jgi:uncharacterized protein YbaA (DUF1428 family)